MQSILKFFEQNYVGLFLMFFAVFFLMLIINWVAWIFGLGRFKGSFSKNSPQGGIFYLFADLVVKIINDFRHLLALILVIIFATALGYAFYFAKNITELSDSLQAVMSTLGTLVGSIVGYYFGESAVKKATKEKEDAKEIVTNPAIQDVVSPPELN